MGLWLQFKTDVLISLAVFSKTLHLFPARVLLSLLALGKFGAGARDLSTLFKNLGVLHLLVLSGSQVGCFVKVWEVVPRSWGWRRGCDQHKIDFFKWTGLLLFFALVPSDPPIVRATFMEAFNLGAPRLKLAWRLALVMALQIAIFPEHLGKLGFYLSWICWALLHLCRAIPGTVVRAVALMVLCQISAILLTGSAAPSFRSWLVVGIANLLLLNLFETWVFPLTAGVLSLAILTAPLIGMGLLWPVEALASGMSPFLNGGYGLVLVALEGFRYIH